MKKLILTCLLIASSYTSIHAQSHAQDSFRIAVICHIIHQGQPIGTGSNVSAAQVRSQFIVLNEDFNRRNPDTVNTPAIFRDVAAAIPIRFAPAKIDTSGKILAEPGINRIKVGQAKLNKPEIDRIQIKHAWDPDKYLNIFVLAFGDDLGGAIGFARYPSRSTLSNIPSSTLSDSRLDGIVLQTKHFGSNYTSEGNRFDLAPAPYGRGRVVTHEVGHYLGLVHTWGDGGGCGVDDGVEDTPAIPWPSRPDTVIPCTKVVNTCGVGEPNDLPDMYQNYMDYSGDACMNIFTKGQKARMVTVLKNAYQRKNLDAHFASVATLGVEQDSLVLVELYKATNGANWSQPWNLEQPLQTWFGVTIENQRVTQLRLPNNRLKGVLPHNIKYLDSLEELNLAFNQITKLPVLTSMAKLRQLKIQNNYLDFSMLAPNLAKLKTLENYSPQFIRTGRLYGRSAGRKLTLAVKVRGANNRYQWYKNNVPLAGQTDSTLVLANIQRQDGGYYHCQVTRSDLAGLILRSLPDTLRTDFNSPTSITLSNTAILENKPIGTEIGYLTTTDLDLGDTHTYSLSGPDAANFKIVGNRLQSAVVFDFETRQTYRIKLRTTDNHGLGFERWVEISVLDVAESPPPNTPNPTALPAVSTPEPDRPILIYPNPSSGLIKITGLDNVSKLKIQILNLRGEVVKTYTQNQPSYDLSTLASGIYIALIQADNDTKYLTFSVY